MRSAVVTPAQATIGDLPGADDRAPLRSHRLAGFLDCDVNLLDGQAELPRDIAYAASLGATSSTSSGYYRRNRAAAAWEELE